MKRLLAATLLLFFLEGSIQIISAQTDAVKTLRGLRGVGVIIEGTGSDAKKAGLTESQLRTDVEVELRKAGIPVLTENKRYSTPGMPYLHVNVTSVTLGGNLKWVYAYNVSISLKQMVDLGRNRSIGTVAETWNSTYVGGVGEKVRDYINEFINDYLTVNPK